MSLFPTVQREKVNCFKQISQCIISNGNHALKVVAMSLSLSAPSQELPPDISSCKGDAPQSSCIRQPDPSAAERALAGLTPSQREELRSRLSRIQWMVTMENGTEPPFRNEFWNNHKPGIYLCLISGEPLFSSTDKFDSGTGWPSFTKPIRHGVISEHKDHSHGMVRVEVRSIKGNSHLGHVFQDGPTPTGLRYCINSAALRFVPAEDLDKENLGHLKPIFKRSEK